MKKKWIAFLVFLCAFFALTMPVCAATMQVGQSKTLYASQVSNVTTYVWYTSDSDVVSIERDGSMAYITAHQVGKAYIDCKASCSYYEYDRRLNTYLPRYEEVSAGSWVIEVEPRQISSSDNDSSSGSGNSSSSGSSGTSTPTVAVEKLTLSKKSITLQKGKSYTISIKKKPGNANQAVYLKNSNDKVVSYYARKITALAPGKAVLTFYTSSGVSAKCTVTVKAKLKKVKFAKSKITMAVGDKLTPKVTITPADTTDKLTWKSSKTSVATVNSKGKVTAKKVGKTTISVYANGKRMAKYTVTVKKKVTKVKLKNTSLTLKKGTKKKLSYTLSPSGSYGKVTWKSSKSSVVSVDSSGKVTAKAPGSATITAKVSSKVYAKCKVTVKSPASSVSISESNITLSKGQKYKLNWKVSPADTTDKIVWKSGNSSVVTVDSAGNLTAVGDGSATVTVSTGKYSDQCNITVNSIIPATGITMGESDPAVAIGSTMTIPLTLNGPYNITDKASDVIWTSSNLSIARVGVGGVVTGVSEGHVTITAALRNYTVTRNLVVTQGSWADISKGTVKMYGSYYTQNGEENYYSNDTTLTIVQSDPSITSNYVYYHGSPTAVIILSGVTIDHITRSEYENGAISVKTMKGTVNTITDGIYARYGQMIFSGEGKLTIKGSGNVICDVKTQLAFVGGEVEIISSSSSSIVCHIYKNGFVRIESGAIVRIIGGSRAFPSGINITGTYSYSSR